jgi:uncharacterized membrane protein
MSTRETASHEGDAPRGIVTADREPRNFDRPLAWILLITGAGAWLAAATLVGERLNLYKDPGYKTSCDINPWLSCGTVMKSWQAGLFGFPNPFIGIVGFGIVVTIAMALLAGARFQRWFWICLQIGLLLCLIMLGWLYYSAVFVIGALCVYCMIVWFFALPMFFYTLRRNLIAGVIPAGRGVVDFFEKWTFVLVAVLEIIVFGAVFLLFINAFI